MRPILKRNSQWQQHPKGQSTVTPILQEPESAIRSEQHEDINLASPCLSALCLDCRVPDKGGQWIWISRP
ncbi:MAG: hypothetical protein U0T81_09380 [Saprospiraceae bacterium]